MIHAEGNTKGIKENTQNKKYNENKLKQTELNAEHPNFMGPVKPLDLFVCILCAQHKSIRGSMSSTYSTDAYGDHRKACYMCRSLPLLIFRLPTYSKPLNHTLQGQDVYRHCITF